MTVVVRRPAPPLDRLVRAIVYRSGEQPRTSVEKILPGPGTGLWVNLNRDQFRSFGTSGGTGGFESAGGPKSAGGAVRSVPGAMVAGPTSRASVIEFEQGHAHVSVEFAFGAAACFFPVPLALTRDDLIPLESVWGRTGACLRDRLLSAGTPGDALAVMEDVLRGQLAGVLGSGSGFGSGLRPEPAVLAAARGLSRGVPVGEVSRDLGLLPRTMRRRFTAQVGLTPKRFARVQRMQRLVRDLDGQEQVDWAGVAARHGYADQPHLADEFRELAGVTPGEYLRSRVNGPNHLRFPSGT